VPIRKRVGLAGDSKELVLQELIDRLIASGHAKQLPAGHHWSCHSHDYADRREIERERQRVDRPGEHLISVDGPSLALLVQAGDLAFGEDAIASRAAPPIPVVAVDRQHVWSARGRGHDHTQVAAPGLLL
jgi:hypothetical protein